MLAESDDFTLCISMIDKLKANQFRPEYISFTAKQCEDNSWFCNDICINALNKTGMYEYERSFPYRVHTEGDVLTQAKTDYYKLKPEFTPF